MLVGLGAIAAGAGFVSPLGAMIIGLIAGISCFYAIHFIKQFLEIDDALDVFPIHGVGGIVGLLLTAFFADTSLGGSGILHASGIIGQFTIQCIGILTTLIWSGLISYLLLIVIDRLIGLKTSQEDEILGLDIALHDQQGYN